jgi:hypothetical protein
MRLEPHVVSWLRERLHCAADESDLATTYDFDHPLNHDRSLVRQVVDRMTPEESVLWHVEFRAPDGVVVLDGRLARRVFSSTALFASRGRTGIVAYNARFQVRAEFRGQQFARSVYASERELYRRWGVQEIQLRAVDDGPVVWVKSFGFQPQEPEFLAEAYRSWATRNGRPADPPDDVTMYPEPFLSTCQGLMLYKVLQ